MSARILTPEARAYLVGIAVLACAGIPALTDEVLIRWSAAARLGVERVQCIVTGFAAALGLAVLGADRLLSGSVRINLLAVPLGALAGLAASWSDRAVVRRTVRRRAGPPWGAPTARGAWPQRPTAMWQADASARWRRQSRSPASPAFLVTIAILEELAYRNVLVNASFRLASGAAVSAALLGSIAFFALAHVRFGWPHVIAKVPLGVLALATVLALGTVVAAATAHVIFNLLVWRDQRDQAVLVRPGQVAPVGRDGGSAGGA